MRRLEQALQRSLARDQRLFGQIAAVQIKQIENPIDEAIAAALLQIVLQHRETRNALVVLDDQFTVEERRLRRKRGDRLGNTLEAMRPIELFAREQLDLAAIEPRFDAVAVEFDLVDPIRPAWRGVVQRRQTRRNEIGQSPASTAARR